MYRKKENKKATILSYSVIAVVFSLVLFFFLGRTVYNNDPYNKDEPNDEWHNESGSIEGTPDMNNESATDIKVEDFSLSESDSKSLDEDNSMESPTTVDNMGPAQTNSKDETEMIYDEGNSEQSEDLQGNELEPDMIDEVDGNA